MEPFAPGNAPVSRCPKCQTVNPSQARFCSACGAPLGERQPAPPPLPPPPEPRLHPIDGRPSGGGPLGGLAGRGLFSGGAADHRTTVAGDAGAAFAQAVHAIAALGGQLQWQSPPQRAQFTLTKRDLWTTGRTRVAYHGELTVAPVSPHESAVSFNLKVNWATTMPVFVMAVVGLLFVAMLNPYFVVFLTPLGLLTLVYTGWAVSSKLPAALAKDLLKQLQGAPVPRPAAWSAPAPVPQRNGAPVPAHAYAFEPAPRVPPPAAPPAPERGANVFDQIKQLAGLRDAGAITAEEYEVKKTELLKRL